MKPRLLRLRAAMAELPPEQLALVLSLGLVLGVFPIFGLPTLLCLLAALGLRLNVAALQLLNQIASDRKSTRLNSSHITPSRMPSSA